MKKPNAVAVVAVVVGVSMTVLSLAGCATTRQDWEKARSADTVATYNEFATKYPQSEFTPAAQSRITELMDSQDWARAESQGTAIAYQEYLTKRPGGKFATDARGRIADYQRFAAKHTTDSSLANQGMGAMHVQVAGKAELFVIPFDKGLTLVHDDRMRLRDELLSATASAQNQRLPLKPGRYVVALKSMHPRRATLQYELGAAAPGNLIVAPSKDSNSEVVVGGGIEAGALFKSVNNIYLIYSGAFFAQGPGSPNRATIAKYKYIRLQGMKDMMFRFVKDSPTFELWLLSEWDLKSGDVYQASFTVPSE